LITLAFDTALGACSVALGDGTTCLAARYEEREAGQAERLIPMMADVLAEAALAASAIERIGVTIGPGSFTGTRIGLAAARAMGVALGIPVIGLTTLDALSASAPPEEDVLIAFDARRSQIYVQLFSAEAKDGTRKALSEPVALSVERAAQILPTLTTPRTKNRMALLGSAAEMLAAHWPQPVTIIPAQYPIAADFLPRIARAQVAMQTTSMPRPLYLRSAPEAESAA